MSDSLLVCAERFVESLERGMPTLVSQGPQSASFQSRADETSAALRDLKAAIAREKADSEVQRLRAALPRLQQQLEVAEDRAQSWKNMYQRLREKAGQD